MIIESLRRWSGRQVYLALDKWKLVAAEGANGEGAAGSKARGARRPERRRGDGEEGPSYQHRAGESKGDGGSKRSISST